jgi:glycosyltransferase involved in cell wall biosynthesis
VSPRVDQFLPILIGRDAVGQHTIAVQQLLTDAGVDSTIYTGSSESGFSDSVRPMGEWHPKAGDVAMYHVATGSPIADRLAADAHRLVLDHHNITPPHHFALWSAEMVQGSAWGVRQLHELAPRAELGLADSSFNADQLAAAGCDRTDVAPILFDPSTLGGSGIDDPSLAHDAPVWLFVGRIAPNKAHQDIIRAFARFRSAYAPSAVLRFVGMASPPTYDGALRRLIADLGLDDAVEMRGRVSDDELASHYRAADVFVCLSRHEGFCVPILEAFHHGVPVVALRSSAVTETVGGGGIVGDTADPDLGAAAARLVVSDPLARQGVVGRGRRRLDDFDPASTGQRLLDALAPILGP